MIGNDYRLPRKDNEYYGGDEKGFWAWIKDILGW